MSGAILQGTKKDRVGGDEHMAVVEEFCYAVKDKWPHALIQFEDFQTDRAFAILEKLQDKVLCFNDDIQVTCCSKFGKEAIEIRHPAKAWKSTKYAQVPGAC